ncbi:uncharacterized protein LOC130691222 isoform X2 [Daphnia carinata]|uniref:uncharacterized protein LOC130691222 isoform X2 n=1 Tax=Daphnia carinata TaxID=120202 RepID=UPI00257F4992|nr:uncharacterized protein LOC130691222 isoform X2 [Daphnia carinata]
MKMVPAPPPMTSSPIMSSAHQQFEVTEDTPVDFLEGCMEILVIFPNEKSILMSIQRRMPMLDLLIHVTAANKISPAAHLLQVTDEEGRFLPHKPSTPIGSLNAHKVYILAKNRLMSDRSDSRSSNAKSSSASQFEQSFRVQVRLPRNQLFVTRVTGRTQLADLLHTVCNEKALDPRHYELRHPVNLDERLRLSSCLDDYKLQEVVLVPLGGKNASLLTPSVSVSDLSSSSSNSMNRKSVNLSASNSSKMSSKSTLKPTTSEATLVGHEKKKRGLLGLLGFGKHKKGSSMGDSGMGDSVGDRSISPSRSEEPVPPAPPVEPVAPSPPSPVLFSKRLAEEAVAKRNSRLMLSQMSTEAFTTPTSTDGPPPLRKTISTTSNGATPPANKPIAKKKRAPAPPQPPPSTQSNGMNGPPKISVDKAASEVSSYSTSSSSGSNYVSPTTSVIHHSEEEVVLRSSSPKLSYQRQDSNYMSRQRQPDSGCSSPVRSPRSNMITTPGNSSSNLTQVSSTSNASLASAIKKRKAPVPPPALDEQVEASEKIPPATVTVVVDGSHDDSDRVSSVSDQLSSVSDLSSTRKSETPDIIEPAIVVELTPQHRHYEQQQQQTSVTPVPAARTRAPRPVKSATTPPPSPCDEGQVIDLLVKVLRDHHEASSNRKLSSSFCSSSSEGDDLTLDDQSLDMFSSRNELNQTSKAQRAVLAVEVAAVDKRQQQQQQLELRSIQGTEAERLKLARQQQTIKLEQENLTRQNIPMLATMEQPSVSPAEVEHTKRKKWDRSPQSQVDLLATRTDSSDDEMSLKVPIPLNRRPRVPSAAAMSHTSSVSEFFSLSEAESESPIQERTYEVVGWSEENEENMDDPDVSFAAMCAALARRKQRGDLDLPNDLSVVSIETVQSPDQMGSSSSGSSQLGGGDSVGGGFWQRPDIKPDLDSPRSIATDSTNANSERPANSISSEDDYEQLEYRRKNSDEKEKNDSYREAHEEEETVVSEPIYTMVIKPPKPLVAVDLEPQTNDKMEQTNEDVQVDEPDRCDVKAIVMLREEEPEMERDAGDGQTESPIMWEYKLPAPPTPFQDSAQSPLDKLQIASESELSRSTRSSMSTDSLQQNRSADEENFAKDSPRSSIDCQEPEAETSAEISIKEDNDVKEVALKLHRGLELLGETTTEEPSLDDPAIEEVVNVAEENKVVLQSSDPEAKPYGIESTTDEPMSQPSSLPPMPSTLPPIDSDDEFSPPDMQFSIATYTVRVSKDSPYEKKLTRPVLPEEVSENIINPINDSTKEANNPLPIVTETKEQEMIADPVKTEENSGSSPVPAAGQLPLPMLNADFIQQFQNALHSITDPKARALQEEFLRLQQQFLTLQMQAVVQQNSAVTVESDPVDISTDHSDTTTLKEKTVLIEEAPTAADLQAEPLVEADSKQIQLVESPVEPPLKITDPAQEQLPKQEIELELETPVYRYTGPPQVKLDTWKPGRPRSEVIDYSRSSSFNVPLAPVEKKIDAPVIGTVAATVLAMDTNTSSPTVATIPEEVVLPVQVSRIPEEESKIKPIVSEVEEILAVREKIEHIESSSNNSSNCTSPVLKPIVLRKSSFITARPFEARPVSMPIRRPNFTPMVIQPVPFVFGKMRAPEVRGFASLPPDNRVEMQGIRMTGPTGVTPFSAVNKNRSIAPVSKENPTIVIRNKLIESARRPSAELNGTPLKSEDSPDQVEDTFAEVKETSPAAVETRRTTSSIRPLSMPMSSSLLLAAGAGGVVNKPQPLSPEISKPPIAAQPTAISGADPSTTAGRRSLSSKFVRKVDPREELLNSIRSFANGGSLKKTGASLDK